MAGSGTIHLAYFVTLQRGYREGDLSLVYPLARGTGPTLSTAAAVLFLGERPSAVALCGAALVSAGILMLARGSGRHARAGLLFGLATGALIAVYTLWDKHAVDALAVPPLVHAWASDIVRATLLAPAALRGKGSAAAVWREHRKRIVGVAAMSPLAYVLVLTAMTFTPVSYVAPAREVSILVGAWLGVRYLGEAHGLRRTLSSVAIVAGVVALAVG